MRILDGGTKWCPRCRDFRPSGQFGVDRLRPDGKHVYCRNCRKSYKQRAVASPQYKFYTESDYPNRLSVPRNEHDKLDDLTSMGERVVVIDGSGQEHEWQSLD